MINIPIFSRYDISFDFTANCSTECTKNLKKPKNNKLWWLALYLLLWIALSWSVYSELIIKQIHFILLGLTIAFHIQLICLFDLNLQFSKQPWFLQEMKCLMLVFFLRNVTTLIKRMMLRDVQNIQLCEKLKSAPVVMSLKDSALCSLWY